MSVRFGTSGGHGMTPYYMAFNQDPHPPYLPMDLGDNAPNLDLLCTEASEATQMHKLVAEFERQLPVIRERVAEYQKRTEYHGARTPLVTGLKEGDEIMI